MLDLSCLITLRWRQAHWQTKPFTTPTNSRQLKRPRLSPESPPRNVTSLSPADLEAFLRCFIMDLEDVDELTDADLKAMASLPPHLQGNSKSRTVPRLTYNKSKPENSNSISSVWSTGLCEPHQGLSTKLVKSIFDNLFGLIFYPPPPFDPAVQRSAYGMVLAGMKSVMNRNYDEEYGYLDESVFKPCMACACRKLLSDNQFLHTLLLTGYCTDPPATELIIMLENVWNIIIPSLRPGFTTESASVWINSALWESRALRRRLSNSNIEIEYVDIAATDSMDTPF